MTVTPENIRTFDSQTKIFAAAKSAKEIGADIIVVSARNAGFAMIVNTGHGIAAQRFLQANAKHMHTVAFGAGHFMGLEPHRIACFIGYAAKNGLRAVKIDGDRA